MVPGWFPLLLFLKILKLLSGHFMIKTAFNYRCYQWYRKSNHSDWLKTILKFACGRRKRPIGSLEKNWHFNCCSPFVFWCFAIKNRFWSIASLPEAFSDIDILVNKCWKCPRSWFHQNGDNGRWDAMIGILIAKDCCMFQSDYSKMIIRNLDISSTLVRLRERKCTRNGNVLCLKYTVDALNQSMRIVWILAGPVGGIHPGMGKTGLKQSVSKAILNALLLFIKV